MVAQRLKLWITGQKVRGFKPQHCQNVPDGLISKLHNPPYSSGGPSHLTQTSDSSFQTRQRLLNRNISFYSGIIITRGVANALNLHMGVKGILQSLIDFVLELRLTVIVLLSIFKYHVCSSPLCLCCLFFFKEYCWMFSSLSINWH